jgi:hypothetical protein
MGQLIKKCVKMIQATTIYFQVIDTGLLGPQVVTDILQACGSDSTLELLLRRS